MPTVKLLELGKPTAWCWAAMLISAPMVMPGGTPRASGEIVFGTPRLLFENAKCPSVSCDGLTLYLAADWPGGYGELDLWVTTRATTEDEWGTPTNLGPAVNSSGLEALPAISADGLTLIFGDSNMSGVPPLPGGLGDFDLWMTTRATTEDEWNTKVNVGAPINSFFPEGRGTMSPDGLAFYFVRSHGVTQMDIWVANRATVDDDWDAPVSLGTTVNSEMWEQPGNISTDGLTLVLASNRPGGFGGNDLWMTTRPTRGDDWGSPVNLGPVINSESWEWAPWVSADFPAVGSTLYFVASDPLTDWNIYAAEVTSGSGLEGDFDGDGVLSAADIHMLTAEVLAGTHLPEYDLNQDALVTAQDGRVWVKDLKYTYFGDANLDREFSSADMVQVFTAGKYESDENAGWAEGDWNSDGVFSSRDMVTAFVDGGYEKGVRTGAVAVPEPSGWRLLILGAAYVGSRRRRWQMMGRVVSS